MEDDVVELNVGGCLYSTALSTIALKYPKSKLALSIIAFRSKSLGNYHELIPILKDSKRRLVIDRDGKSFRYVLNYLRRVKSVEEYWIGHLIPNSNDRSRLLVEAEYYGLHELAAELSECRSREANHELTSRKSVHETQLQINRIVPRIANIETQSSLDRPSNNGQQFLTIGYRGSHTAARDGPSNEMSKFRRITRIVISGRCDVAKEVFQDDLNESRDPERYPNNGYTSRYFLKHNYLEKAFETLAQSGFELITSCSSGARTLPTISKQDFKQWNTYIEYVFGRFIYKA